MRQRVHEQFDAPEAALLDATFEALEDADGDLFLHMSQIGTVLTDTARSVVRMLAHAQPTDARALVIQASDALEPLQDELAARMADIRRLQADLRRY